MPSAMIMHDAIIAHDHGDTLDDYTLDDYTVLFQACNDVFVCAVTLGSSARHGLV